MGRSGVLWFWKGREGGWDGGREGGGAGVCMCDVSGPEGYVSEGRVK